MTAWRKLSLLYRSEHPMCEKCGEHYAEAVHHIKSFMEDGISKEESIRRLLDVNNLLAVCAECHQAIHEEQEKAKKQWRDGEKDRYYIRY